MKHPDCEVLYSDEDKLDMDGKALFDPHFKPDFNPDLLTSVNYICHLFVVKKDLLDQVGGFRQEFDGAQDYDFIFRCTEAGKRDCPYSPGAVSLALPSGIPLPATRKARCMPLRPDPEPSWPTMSVWELRQRRWKREWITAFTIPPLRSQGEPLVSVIIPNKDHSQDLDVCVRSLMEKSTYRNLEFIVVENNSTRTGDLCLL